MKKAKYMTMIALMLIICSIFTGCGSEEATLTGAGDATEVNYVYLAGPFFDDTEIANIEYAESVLESRGIEFFSPMRHEVDSEPGTTEWAYDIFEMDKEEISKADCVVALYYGNDSDSGTAWECGYAAAIGVPVVLVHVDKGQDSNLMMHCGAYSNIYLEDLETYDFETMPVYEYEGDML